MSRLSNAYRPLQPQRISEANRLGLITPQSVKDRHAIGRLANTRPGSGNCERRISFFGRRSSTIGSHGAFGGPEKIKDPRPLHDKSFVQQCLRQLCEFLGEIGYPQPVSMKSLQSPSTKDFLRIFSFMNSTIDPSYQLPDSKFEEEIPRIFKDLGYPFPLSKSSMYTVGAPHTWPQIVGALIWLMDQIKLLSVADPDKILFGDEKDWDQIERVTEDGVHHNRLFINYTEKCYINFMMGIDNYDDNLDHLSLLKQRFGVDEAQFEAVSAENRSLAQELERLEIEKENEPDRVQALKKTKASLQADLQKYKNYLVEMEAHKAFHEQRANAVREELESAALELKAINEENNILQQKCDVQDISASDVERINRERNELLQTISSLSKILEDVEKRMWNEEINVAKVKEVLEAGLLKYHTLARKLKLIPTTAENAGGHDFEIRLDFDAGQRNISQNAKPIKPNLMLLVRQVNEEINKMKNKKMNVEEGIEQVQSMIAERANDLKLLNEQIRKVDEAMQQEKEEDERKIAMQDGELDSLENKRKYLQKGMTEGLDDALEQRKAARHMFEIVQQKTNEEKTRMTSNFRLCLDSAAQHITSIEVLQLTTTCKV
uniref:Kinetochore protein NDC80 n=1 Tax=Callorhinchus milii TaxID=7868 RepID=A0A4W3GX44_CALMI